MPARIGAWANIARVAIARHRSRGAILGGFGAMARRSLLTLPAALEPGSPRVEGRYVMGLDGGATKTLAAVLDLERLEAHVAQTGPSNEDAVGLRAVDAPVHVNDIHATILHLMGLHHLQLTYPHNGRAERPTRTGGKLITKLWA